MIVSSNKTIGYCEFNVENLSMFVGCTEDNPSLGVVLSKAESCLERNEEEYVTHKYIVLEEAESEILLLEILLEKFESDCELESRVNKLCFNSFDEELKYLQECIGKYEIVKDSVSLDKQMGMLSSNDKGKYELLQQKGSTQSLINEGIDLIEEDETIMSRMKEPVVVKDREQLVCFNSQEKTVRQTSRVVIEMGNQNSILIKN